MRRAEVVFQSNMQSASDLARLYDYLTGVLVTPMSFADLLRFQVVHAVSALDKLVHDLVFEGLLEMFSGRRARTQKYLQETMPLSLHHEMASPLALPPEVAFEQQVRAKLKRLTFQDPDDVADGLAYIWSEPHKWQKIAATLGAQDKTVRTRLKLVVVRRNAIVHEADMDPVTHEKQELSRDDADGIAVFLRGVGKAICTVVP